VQEQHEMRSMMSQVGLRPIDGAYFDVTAIANPEQQMIRRLPVHSSPETGADCPRISTPFSSGTQGAMPLS